MIVYLNMVQLNVRSNSMSPSLWHDHGTKKTPLIPIMIFFVNIPSGKHTKNYGTWPSYSRFTVI